MENKKDEFVFSIIMAVYNTEQFLAEAIDSLLEQDYGFYRVQLILVDDGSQDNSPAICDAYASKYPENIIVIHKENGGVSSARNAGLDIATGTYINFMDSDDKMDSKTLNIVRQFILRCEAEKKEGDINVISIPVYFFDGAKGEHILNTKFKKGNRIIDLYDEPEAMPLGVSSCFIKRTAIEELNLRFDTNLKFAEDTKFVQRVLLINKKLAVVKDGKYLYRRRTTGEQSAIQMSSKSQGWWLPYIEHFQKENIEYCLEQFGEVPEFIQEALCYDLQWRIKQPTFNRDLMTEEEIDEYRRCLHFVLQHIEDRIILKQKNIYIDHKIALLRLKYAYAPRAFVYPKTSKAEIYYPGSVFSWRLNDQQLIIYSIEIKNQTVYIEGRINEYGPGLEVQNVQIALGGKTLAVSEWNGEPQTETALDEILVQRKYFKLHFNLEPEQKIYNMALFAQYSFGIIRLNGLVYHRLSPINQQNFLCCEGNIITCSKTNIRIVNKPGFMKCVRKELGFDKKIWKNNKQYHSKLHAAMRVFYHVAKALKRKEIWLISDRVDRAGDNGEAFFEFLRKTKPKGIKAYFVLKKESLDYERVSRIGQVLPYLSKKHKLFTLLADKIVDSSGLETAYIPFASGDIELYRDILFSKSLIFLQHGITKDDQSRWLNYYNKRFSGFVTSAESEYNSILYGKGYYYDSSKIWLTGMPRFDKLNHTPQKKITIMPTWRSYLLYEDKKDENGYRIAKSGFENSAYFNFYSSLLNNRRLIDAAQKYNYTIQFFAHPNMIKYVEYFQANEKIEILHKDTEYTTVYSESDLIITDYSSTVFDFAYMYQPVLYLHFDKEEFFSGEHTYSKGYFDYEENGFGEVEYDLDSAVNRIIEYMKNGCKLKPMYKERIDKFFAFHDKNNCQRVFEKIKAIGKEDEINDQKSMERIHVTME